MENRQTETSPVRNDDQRAFLIALALTVAARAWLASAFPITGDEAYYWDWGRHLAGGYYDQPPMAGWILGLLQMGSNHLLMLRLPALLFPPVAAACWVAIVRRFRPEPSAGWLTGTLVLLLPWSFLEVLFTTDTPLLVFSALSLFCFLRAFPRDERSPVSLPWIALAGAAGGAAFLSKYFVVLLLPVFAALLLFEFRGGRPKWSPRGLLPLGVLLASAAPAAIWHLYWNYENCWINFVFNLVSRNRNEHYNLRTPLLFLGHQLYLLSPLLILAARRFDPRAHLRMPDDSARRRAISTALGAFALGVGAFAFSSLKHGQGLHWTLSFHLPLWLGLGLLLPVSSLRKGMRTLALFTGLHLAAVALALALPTETYRSLRAYRSVVLLKHPDEIAAEIRARLPAGTVLATNSYTLSSVLGWASGGEWDLPLILNGSRFGRQSDLIHDWRNADGRDVAIYSFTRIPQRKLTQYFESVDIIPLETRGARTFLTIGHRFRFEAYRNGMLRKIRDRYYRLPAAVPCGGCSFLSRYFPEQEKAPTGPAGSPAH